MKVRELMTPDAQCVRPDETLVDAALLMRQLDIGALPVCVGGELVGMLTDRDLAIRAVADGLHPATTLVREVMSPGTVAVYEDEEVDAAVRLFERHRVRRAPVMNRANQLVGIVSLGDIAVDGSAELSAEILRRVSQPAEPVR